VVGVALTGFVLMPVLGLWATILLGAGVNVGGGLVVLALPALQREPGAPVREALPAARPSRLLLAVALLSGATSLATQVAWTRVLVLVVGSTTYSFTIVLLTYLLALGVGSAWASRWGPRRADVRPVLAVAHLVMALGTLGAVYAVADMPYWYTDLVRAWRPAGLASLLTLNTLVVFALLCVPLLSAGTILPLAMIGVLPATVQGT